MAVVVLVVRRAGGGVKSNERVACVHVWVCGRGEDAMHSCCVAQCDLHICPQLHLKPHTSWIAGPYSCAAPRGAKRSLLHLLNTNQPPTPKDCPTAASC